MRQSVYTITAAPMFPNGKTGFWRTVGEGTTLASALRDAAVWAEDFDPVEHSERCESCGGHGSEDCDNEHCENGREAPEAFDVTASWSEIEGERLEKWRRDRRLLIAKRSADHDALADKRPDAEHSFTYGIDAYGRDPRNEDATRTIRGPAGLSRSEAIEYLTQRLRELWEDGDCPNPSGNWRIFAHEILDRADAEPTRPQSAGVSDQRGAIVTAEAIPRLARPPGADEATEVDTARPAVALVMGPGQDRAQASIVCGYWQPDGSWADAPVAVSRGGLLERIGERLEETRRDGGAVSVLCQSFSGALTRTFRYHPGPPEVGPVDLPTDPEAEPSP